MKATARKEVSAGLAPNLARLWRYALVLSGARDVADDLVQATCVRALERAEQFQLGTRWTGGCFRFFGPSGSMSCGPVACAWAAASSTLARRWCSTAATR